MGSAQPSPPAKRPPVWTATARRNAIVLTVSMVLLYALWHNPIVYPLKLLVVLFHELGHAVATLATGGSVVELSVDPRQGGYTLSQGGNRFLILNGGYLGSLAFGVALLTSVRRPTAGRLAAGFLAAAALFAALLWVPILSFGFLFVALSAAAFGALALKATAAVAMWAVRTVGLFCVMYALVDIRDDVFRVPGCTPTDATMLAELTHVPAPVWGLAWTTAGLALLWKVRRSLI